MKKKPNLARLFLCLLFIQAACHKEDPKPVTELEKLPPATSEGKNTFGCLVNGKAWVTETSIDATAVYQLCNFYMGAGINTEGTDQKIYIHMQSCSLATSTYELNSKSSIGVRFRNNENCTYDEAGLLEGRFTVTLLDFRKGIIAGSFSFTSVTSQCDTLKVTDGRFDLSLIL